MHSLEGDSPFHEERLKKIAALKEIYEIDYDAGASHHFVEE